MSGAAPPAWVMRQQLPSGEWRCLVGLWSFAPYGSDGSVVVWPSRAKLAEATGQTVSAVAAQLRKLADRGFVERLDGTRVLLRWLPASSTRLPASSDRLPASPTTSVAAPTTTALDPAISVVGGRLPASPQTLQGTYKNTPKNVAGDARAIEDETPSQRHARLAAARLLRAEADAARDPSPSMGGLSTAYLDAIVVAAEGKFWRELESRACYGAERETWCEQLARLVEERSEDVLSPEAVGRVLDAWLDQRGKPGTPTRREIWWSSSWPWVAGVLGLEHSSPGRSKFAASAPGPEGYDFTEDDIRREHYAGTGRAC